MGLCGSSFPVDESAISRQTSTTTSEPCNFNTGEPDYLASFSTTSRNTPVSRPVTPFEGNLASSGSEATSSNARRRNANQSQQPLRHRSPAQQQDSDEVPYTHRIDYVELDASYVVEKYYWNAIENWMRHHELMRDTERLLIDNKLLRMGYFKQVLETLTQNASEDTDSISMLSDDDSEDELPDNTFYRLELLKALDLVTKINPATLKKDIKTYLDGLSDQQWFDDVSNVCVIDRSDTSIDDEDIKELSKYKVTGIQVYERAVKGSSGWKRWWYGNVHQGVIVTLQKSFLGCAQYLIHILCDETSCCRGQPVVVPITSVNTDDVWSKVKNAKKFQLTRTSVRDCLRACGRRYNKLCNNCRHAATRMMNIAR